MGPLIPTYNLGLSARHATYLGGQVLSEDFPGLTWHVLHCLIESWIIGLFDFEVFKFRLLGGDVIVLSVVG